ncbi:MAG: NADH-quinone oxidoreductase subunit I [bacterium]|nr:NADH-quinone oxidoreductase subunit I [bacterium]
MVQYFADIYQAVSSAIQGMGITIKHIYRKPVTLQFPDERQVMPDRFRGFVHNDMTKCDSCNICAKLCPVDCIYIETEGKGKERMMTRYAIDYNKCIWCSLCTENCHTGSITMSHDYDHSVYDRRSLVYEFMDPNEQKIPCHRATRTEMDWWVEPKAEKKPKPKPAADTKPATETPTEAAPAPEAAPPVDEKKPEPPAADPEPTDGEGEDK